jgi:hypothetical protein
MKGELANSLLHAVTEWNAKQLDTELPLLNFMANMKYDHYDQFMPGSRFLSNLVKWLAQFETKAEKDKVYRFFKENLIFISSTQMSYLIELMYSTMIKPVIRNLAAKRNGDIPLYYVQKIEKSDIFKYQKRLSLIVGLSDGSHTDILRRVGNFSNEQMLTIYYPNEEKMKEMLQKLKQVEGLKEQGRTKFETLFLIDDFTASGTSFVREKEGVYKGKIVTIIEGLQTSPTNNVQTLKSLFPNKVDIHIVFCIATESGLEAIKKGLKAYISDKNLQDSISYTVNAVMIIKNAISEDIKADIELEQILKNPKYFDEEDVVTDRFKNGKHDKPYYGYNECALPIILAHNTPNNTLPLLWQANKFKGLFPRINRNG